MNSDAAQVFKIIRCIGGNTGGYNYNWLWKLRGWIDLFFGGVGLRRGRKDPDNLSIGDALDFWRVDNLIPDQFLLLQVEMKLPGRDWLQFELNEMESRCEIVRTAIYDPMGLWRFVYWYILFPAHRIVFGGMLRDIANKL